MIADAQNDEAAQILRLRAASNAAIAAHDVDGLAACVTSDICVTTGNGQVCIGQAAMRERFSELFARLADVVYLRLPDKIEVSSAAPLACEQGQWLGRWTEAGQAVQVGGHYTAMWRRDEAGWRIRAELYVLLQRSEHPVAAA